LETRLTLATMKRAIRRLAALPGQRAIIFASPGFFAQAPEAIKATAEVLELAAKSGVVINGLSARGVILAEEEEDVASRKVVVSRRAPPSAASPEQLWIRYRRESAAADGDVMKDLAEGTGGVFFHDNNNLRLGFERVAAAPEFSYVLGFSPAALKPDGTFHALRIHLRNEKGVSIEARRGYYAVTPDAKDVQLSRAELEEAILSRDERSDVPVVLLTGSSMAHNAGAAKVLTTAKIDVASLASASFDVAATLFDQEGAYVTGTAETVKFDASRKDLPVTLHWEFPDIPPGNYVVSLVVREPKSKSMTTINRTLIITAAAPPKLE
jgi:hypothetical protein